MKPSPAANPAAATLRFHHAVFRCATSAHVEFVDLTERVLREVAQSGVRDGFVNVQTRHTTTAVIVNENEPLLLDDLRELLERWAPADGSYRHDRFDIRTVNMTACERVNGHSHARAVTLGASETLNVVGGVVQLGRWQRIFLVELDGGREREVSVVAVGLTGSAGSGEAVARSEPGANRRGTLRAARG